MRFHWRHPAHTDQQQIQQQTQQILQPFNVDIQWEQGAAPYQSSGHDHATNMQKIIFNHTGITPKFTQSGGASDGRFFAPISQEIFEFGPLNQTIHQVNENIATQDITLLSSIYVNWLAQTDASFAK